MRGRGDAMKLLYDSMLDEACLNPRSDKFDKMIEVLKDAKVFVIDNVAQYYFEVTEQDFFDISSDFPNIAPVYESMFFEYSLPEFVRHKGFIEKSTIPVSLRKYIRSGLLIHSEKTSDGWTMTGLPFMRTDSKHIGRLFAFSIKIEKDGSVIDSDKALTVYYDDGHTDLLRRLGKKRIVDMIAQFMHPALMALSFMHCKNVEIISNNPPIKLSRKNIKEYGRPLVTYKTLSIEPLKQILRSEGDADNTGVKQALHICRGHFKDFSKGDGLFGKYKGLYWWSSHIRGDSSRGVVVKDYSINAPSA